jgi:hypothetical protein
MSNARNLANIIAGTYDLPVSSIDSVVNLGKNRIINGAMMIDQRNAGASVSINSSKYTLDRWVGQAQAANVQQITSTISGFNNSLKLTMTGSSSYSEIAQQIEYNNFYDLVGKTVTLGFWAKANNSNAASTNLIIYFRYSTTQDASVYFTSTVFASPTVTIGTTAAFYNVQVTIPATAKAFSFEINCNATGASGDGFEITGVQLEKGSTATSFDYRPYGTELQLCQRYCEAVYATGSGADKDIGIGGGNGNAGNFQAFIEWKTVKRAAPTVSLAAASNFYVHVPGAFRVTCATLSANDASEWGTHLQGYSSSNSFGVGQQCFLAVVPNTTVVIASAEL